MWFSVSICATLLGHLLTWSEMLPGMTSYMIGMFVPWIFDVFFWAHTSRPSWSHNHLSHERWVKGALAWQPGGARVAGRPRHAWNTGVEMLSRSNNWNDWTSIAQAPALWSSHCDEYVNLMRRGVTGASAVAVGGLEMSLGEGRKENI